MRFAHVVLILLGITSPAFSQTMTPLSVLEELRTGWNANSFAVVAGDRILNPANCPIPDGYITDISQPGYRTHFPVALVAYNRPVRVAVHDSECGFAGRPKLIGIEVWAGPVVSDPPRISQIRTGWQADSFAVVPTGEVFNPNNCPTPDGYISDVSQPGYSTYLNAALTAFAWGSAVEVDFALSTECIAGRPKLIGINIKHAGF